MIKPSVTARIRVEVEIPSGNTWDQTTTMEQIVGQAKEVLPKLDDAIRKLGGRILGEPKVISVVADQNGL